MINYKIIKNNFTLLLLGFVFVVFCGLVACLFVFAYKPASANVIADSAAAFADDNLSSGKIDSLIEKITQKKSTRKEYFDTKLKDDMFKILN